MKDRERGGILSIFVWRTQINLSTLFIGYRFLNIFAEKKFRHIQGTNSFSDTEIQIITIKERDDT